jgi:hypothetical protein
VLQLPNNTGNRIKKETSDTGVELNFKYHFPPTGFQATKTKNKKKN